MNEKEIVITGEGYRDKDFEGSGVPEEQRGTPAFFVNGEAFVGAHPYESFVDIIERKLAE